jgi:hypothetical protein
MSRRCSQHSYFPGIVHRILLPLVIINSLAFASQLITVHCFVDATRLSLLLINYPRLRFLCVRPYVVP